MPDPKKSYKKELAFINYTYKAFDGFPSCDRRFPRPQPAMGRYHAGLLGASVAASTASSLVVDQTQSGAA